MKEFSEGLSQINECSYLREGKIWSFFLLFINMCSVVTEEKKVVNCPDNSKNSIEVECIDGCLSIVKIDYFCKSSGDETVRFQSEVHL